MENKEALAMLKQAINYGNNGETVTGNSMLGTDNIEAIRLAIKALKKQETAVEKLAHENENEMNIAQAMGVLKKALLEDQTPGSYYFGWQSNLACVIVDNSQLNMVQANHIAKHFLSLLTSQGE